MMVQGWHSYCEADNVTTMTLRRAGIGLLDQSIIMANPDPYTEFIVQLDAPAQINAVLQKTLKTPAPWDK